MTDADLALVKALVECIDCAETAETQYLYMKMLTETCHIYVDLNNSSKTEPQPKEY